MIWPPRRKASENGLEQVGTSFPSFLRSLSLSPPPYTHTYTHTRPLRLQTAQSGKWHACAPWEVTMG